MKFKAYININDQEPPVTLIRNNLSLYEAGCIQSVWGDKARIVVISIKNDEMELDR